MTEYPQAGDYFTHKKTNAIVKVVYVDVDPVHPGAFIVFVYECPLPEDGSLPGSNTIGGTRLKSMEHLYEKFTPYDGPFPIPKKEKNCIITSGGDTIDLPDTCSIC